ncbi:MAG: maleylpyruvate isomerase family mycothiol-dependent enzyme [Acidobacteriota bacterium]|nr:maleylpyruvate isomerase family mycothiol-dependent enzyme [Acidobacteriota bacterium]
MAWDLERQALLGASTHIASLRKYKVEATQRLLGDTIAISEQAWQEPSRLPGWTRAHVASHLARNADALVRAVDSVLMGRRGLMYDSEEDREQAIERGSERPGLALQIDLDTSAGRLNRRFNVLHSVPQELVVELTPGELVRSDLLPLLRLNEIVLHHIDLDCGYEVTQVEPEIARLLLEWAMLDPGPLDGRVVRLTSDTGFHVEVGSAGELCEIHGSDALLLGWLTGRLSADQAIDLPVSPALT